MNKTEQTASFADRQSDLVVKIDIFKHNVFEFKREIDKM